jgi:hypothetical protein
VRTHRRSGKLTFRARIRKRFLKTSRRALYRNLQEMEAMLEQAKRERDALEVMVQEIQRG